MMLRLISFFFLLPTLFAHEGEHATTLEPPAEPRVEMQMYQDAQGTNLTGFYSQNPNIIEAPTIIIIPYVHKEACSNLGSNPPSTVTGTALPNTNGCVQP